MNIKQAEKKIKQLKEMKTHFTKYADEYREFCVNFLELMYKNNISPLNCQFFKELALPTRAQTFDSVLKYSEIYLKIMKPESNMSSRVSDINLR